MPLEKFLKWDQEGRHQKLTAPFVQWQVSAQGLLTGFIISTEEMMYYPLLPPLHHSFSISTKDTDKTFSPTPYLLQQHSVVFTVQILEPKDS